MNQGFATELPPHRPSAPKPPPLQIAYHDRRLEEVSQHSVRISKAATIEQLLEELRRQLPAEAQGRPLRLMEVYQASLGEVYPTGLRAVCQTSLRQVCQAGRTGGTCSTPAGHPGNARPSLLHDFRAHCTHVLLLNLAAPPCPLLGTHHAPSAVEDLAAVRPACPGGNDWRQLLAPARGGCARGPGRPGPARRAARALPANRGGASQRECGGGGPHQWAGLVWSVGG